MNSRLLLHKEKTGGKTEAAIDPRWALRHWVKIAGTVGLDGADSVFQLFNLFLICSFKLAVN
jgi:hypothetical protein